MRAHLVLALLLTIQNGHGGRRPSPEAPLSAGQNPIQVLVEHARRELPEGWEPTRGETVVVELPAGELPGVVFTSKPGHHPLAKVSTAWLGAATLVLRGHPGGTTIRPMHDERGWGVSLEVRPDPRWEGRVHFHDLTIQGSGGSAVDLGAFGTQAKLPLQDVRFVRCRFVDHPLESVRTKRPISANQTSLHFLECEWDMPRSEEHAVYSRNPYGPASMIDCRVIAVGGQVWQEVGRPSEGPQHEPGTTLIQGCFFRGYHRNPGRAGSALTSGGAARDWIVRDTVVMDLEPSPLTGPPDTTHGGLVVYDGGTYWDLDGNPHPRDSGHDLAGKYANRSLLIEDCLFVQRNPNRSIVQISSLEHGVVRRTGVFGPKPVDVLPYHDGAGRLYDAGVGYLDWLENNRPEDRERALALGVPEELLIDPVVRVRGETAGRATEDIRVRANEIFTEEDAPDDEGD